MVAIDDALIDHVVRTIVEKFDPERVVLFGATEEEARELVAAAQRVRAGVLARLP